MDRDDKFYSLETEPNPSVSFNDIVNRGGNNPYGCSEKIYFDYLDGDSVRSL
jgi:hypothetical protein